MLSDPTLKLVWRMLSPLTLDQIIKISKSHVEEREYFHGKKTTK